LAFLGWLGKSVPAIGNLGYTLGLSDKPVELAGGYTPNPIPAIAGALTGNPALAMAGSSLSTSTSNMGAPLGAYIPPNIGASSMNPTEMAAKWLNAGLAYQPAVTSPYPAVAIETAQSGVIPASWSKKLLETGKDVIGGIAGGTIAGGMFGGDGSNVIDINQHSGTMTPIGKLRLSVKGNLIITRSMKRKMKSLADTVGLEHASALVGIDIRTASAILLKSFPTREKGVTGRELRQCRRVVNKMKHFYSMIPTRSTSSRRSTTVARGVTQIKN
tara:strand:+ start:1101 stop:1919 length:819 start_codon:yes stop_codon:yes gene_type:complete